MQRLSKGTLVRTSYGTGPYRVESVSDVCTCPSFMDSLILGDEAPNSKPHYHIVCKRDGCRDKYHLNGYDENLNSVWSKDRLILCEEETLFLLICCGI